MADNTNRSYPPEQIDCLCGILTDIADRLKAVQDKVSASPVCARSHFSALLTTYEAYNGVEQAIVSLTELGISSKTIARLKDWRDHFTMFYTKLFVSDLEQDEPGSMDELYSWLDGYIPPSNTEEEYKHIQAVRRQWGDIHLSEFRDFITGLVGYLKSLPTTFSGELNQTQVPMDVDAILLGMAPAPRGAWYSHEHARGSMSDSKCSLKQVYEWLERYPMPDYDLPKFLTWARARSTAQSALDLQRNTSRSGRSIGKSIVRAKDVAPPKQ